MLDQQIFDCLQRIEILGVACVQLLGVIVGYYCFILLFGWLKGIVKW